MTPEEAQALEPGTTPEPWKPHPEFPSMAVNMGEMMAVALIPGKLEDHTTEDEANLALICAAPEMRATIAAQTWEYGVQWDADHISWLGTDLPECRRSVEENRENEDLSPSVVRRPVGPVEAVE